MKALLIVSHGSRSPQTKKEIESLIKKIKAKSKVPIVEYAFLELESPSIPEGIKNCIDKGATKVKLLMNFLNSGRHVDQDIPEIVKKEQKVSPKIPITISKPVGQHEGIVDLFLDLIN